jgi:hypothetical protein
MRFIIKEQYFKRTRPKESLAIFEAWRTKNNGTTIRAVIKKDPILKKHPKIEREVVKHEIRELKLNYTDVSKRGKSHEIARFKEPAWLRKEIKKLGRI